MKLITVLLVAAPLLLHAQASEASKNWSIMSAAAQSLNREMSDRSKPMTADRLRMFRDEGRRLYRLARLAGSGKTEAAAAMAVTTAFIGLSMPDSAIRWGRIATGRLRDIGDLALLAGFAPVVVAAYNTAGMADSANAFDHQLSADFDAFARINQLITTALNEESTSLEDASSHAFEALSLAQKHNLPMVQLQMLQYLGGHYRTNMSRLDSARAILNEGVKVAREHRIRESEAQMLVSIAQLDVDAGKMTDAITQTRNAIALVEKSDDEDIYASLLRTLGDMHLQNGDAKTASDVLGKSLALQQDRLASFERAAAAGMSPLGLPPSDKRSELEARFANALRLGLLTTTYKRGNAFESLGSLDSAASSYRASVKGFRSVQSINGQTLSLFFLAQLATKRAIKSRSTALSDSAIANTAEALAIARQAGDAMNEGRAFQMLAVLYMFAPGRQSGQRADAYLDSAISISQALTSRLRTDAARASVAESQLVLQDLWVQSKLFAADTLYNIDNVYAGLAAVERVRARSLLKLISGTSTVTAKTELSREGRELATIAERTGSTILSYHVTEYRLQYTMLTPKGASAGSVQISADSVASMVAEYRNALGVGNVNPSARSAPDLERSGGMRASTGTSGQNIAARMQSMLFPPNVREALPPGVDLVIVPHGALALMPFAALSLPGDSIPLGQRAALRFAPSVTVLRELELRRVDAGNKATAKKLIVGDPAMPLVENYLGEKKRLPQLPGAAVEAQEIAARVHSEYLGSANATESIVKASLPSAGLVHLATHGFAYSSDAKSNESFVALAADARNDGLLTVGEILNDPAIKLSADLVVLSACQTGLGDLKRSEGTIGLQRAFLARGARTVMVSLWSVSDEATSLLMRRFYDHWLSDADKPGKAESLRRAQSDVRRTKGFESPRYWAAFQLAGAA